MKVRYISIMLILPSWYLAVVIGCMKMILRN